jgi:hypothetical protein
VELIVIDIWVLEITGRVDMCGGCGWMGEIAVANTVVTGLR